ncbi:MAG: oleate hydratase [Pilosibacter sp.]
MPGDSEPRGRCPYGREIPAEPEGQHGDHEAFLSRRDEDLYDKTIEDVFDDEVFRSDFWLYWRHDVCL